MLSMKSVEPVQLTSQSRFVFRCHKGITCFTRCCSNIAIMLTPYDILRLKKRLGVSSGEFLQHYTYIHIDEKTSHPFVFLKMNEDPERKCLFVSAEGCTIYRDRPANCRYYPVGQASLKKMDTAVNQAVTEEFYFLVKEEHCLGFKEKNEWTIQSWRDDQGADIYDDMNRGWKEILFRRNLPGNELDEKKQKSFYMACYDVDRFRRFVFESKFLEIFAVEPERLEKIKNDETELMKFGFEYTKYILMMEETLKRK
ncbi:MAG: YkgJ family cysteine cluster protein [Alphaproteobacteria bacterium]|uniref:YkgJ family cysteine cluster protein n=1 Tax=Candidatus Nitrobium versatile TaxID=2884831 RepID=A0A953JAT7_9BACT|nr:YkgJ family cysteine cluster protein [Candidatus Nitrobium versatile]